MSTPHIEAPPGAIASTVLMPGDPLRAQFIAYNFLSEVRLVNQVRNMLGFTGYFQGLPVSVMGSGMGMPSMGIYAHELFSQYGVERIIRVGSCGAYSRELKLFDTLLVDSAWTESTFASLYTGNAQSLAHPHPQLNQQIRATAQRLDASIPTRLARVHSTDVFYRKRQADFRDILREQGCLAVEMEAFALFVIASTLGRQAACLLTVSDCLESGAAASPKERERAFETMIETALHSLKPLPL